jgi:hypothetical protein
MNIASHAILKRIDDCLLEKKQGREALTIALDIPESTSSSWRTSRPKADDIYRIARYLNKTVEELVDGEDGLAYVRQWARTDGKVYEPPERIADIVVSLKKLTDRDLDIVRGTISGMLGKRSEEGTNPLVAAGEQKAV